MFHVFVLKKQIGENHKVLRELPVQEDEDSTELFPQPVLGSRLRKGKNELLIYWSGLSPADATWEECEIIQEHYPDFTLEDKSLFNLAKDWIKYFSILIHLKIFL